MIERIEVEPKLRCLSLSDTYGKFSMEPLEQGYGTTLGTALRRTLLSSIPGTAITSVRLEGVPHEFSTLPGVVEDTLEILLNLKELAIRPTTLPDPRLLGRQWTGRIVAEGVGEVTGADVELPPELEVVNPELHIATLVSEEARLVMELTIEEGVGYRGAEEQRRSRRDPIGKIFTDAVFSPVKKVNAIVEPTRVGRRTDLDRLILEIWTNGAVKPDEALAQASRILDRHIQLFFAAEQLPVEPLEEVWETMEEEYFLRRPIEDLKLAARTYNALKRANILTLHDLVSKTEEELIKIKNFGRRSLEEVTQRLKELGLSLRSPTAGGPEVPHEEGTGL